MTQNNKKICDKCHKIDFKSPNTRNTSKNYFEKRMNKYFDLKAIPTELNKLMNLMVDEYQKDNIE